ncbi:MAG: hypothetical protein AAGD32_07960 [Planctomycetota bacterium]
MPPVLFFSGYLDGDAVGDVLRGHTIDRLVHDPVVSSFGTLHPPTPMLLPDETRGMLQRLLFDAGLWPNLVELVSVLPHEQSALLNALVLDSIDQVAVGRLIEKLDSHDFITRRAAVRRLIDLGVAGEILVGRLDPKTLTAEQAALLRNIAVQRRSWLALSRDLSPQERETFMRYHADPRVRTADRPER